MHYPVTSAVRYIDADAGGAAAESGSPSSSSSSSAVLEVKASVMYPELKSRVEVVLSYDKQVLVGWPESVGEANVRVERVYGAAE